MTSAGANDSSVESDTGAHPGEIGPASKSSIELNNADECSSAAEAKLQVRLAAALRYLNTGLPPALRIDTRKGF
ncbi:MAG: hypothetical protein FKY71_07340 [Spiribacter salinus]|uniref:Uncharacterized protein n=1 Tax=Spiribacter salinus TaxID=1335746 RepID=A0A540VSF6_9GAMM|nr:MAG: hypothetical protein FKY71_07340 [Spiribacter salinus]